MTVQGTPVPATPVTSDDIRRFLRDYAGNNNLLGNVEFSDTDITSAVSFVLSEYDVLPPPIGTITEDLINRAILLRGVCAHLLTSESFLQLRNQATYQAEGMPRIGVDDKVDGYQALAARLDAEWRDMASRVKQRQNMEDAFGHIQSEYKNLGKYTGKW